MGILINYPLFHADDGNGDPLIGGLLYTYITGTTTAKATYTTKAMTVANANPVVLNTRGDATIYGSGLYKLVLKDSDSVTIWTQDDVQMDTKSGSNSYYVDPSEVDQGVAGFGSSLYDILTGLGTSKKAEVYFAHSGTGNTTTYTVTNSFNASTYTNVNFVFENGAILAIATGKYLMFPSPSNISAQPNQLIFSGAGTVTFDIGSGEIYPEWFGAKGDGATDDTTEIQATFTASGEYAFPLTSDNGYAFAGRFDGSAGDIGLTKLYPGIVGRMYHYYEPQYDLSASGLSVQHYFLTGDITVPTGKQYNVMRMEGDVIGYDTVDSKFKGIYWQYTAQDIRDAYCAIGLITNTGVGNTKAIYGRAQASTGCTGVVVGLVAGITLDTGVTVNTACAVQATIEGAGTGSEVIGYWLSTAETTKEIEYGFLASHKLGFSGAAFKGFQIGGATGDAFEWTDSTNNLFKVDYNGNVWIGDETNSQRSVYLYSSARSWALQAVDTGDYLRILIGSSGNGLILDSNRNLGVGGLNSFGGGTGGCVCIPNAAVNPSTDPVGGGILYCSAGTLYFRTSSGNVRTVAAV